MMAIRLSELGIALLVMTLSQRDRPNAKSLVQLAGWKARLTFIRIEISFDNFSIRRCVGEGLRVSVIGLDFLTIDCPTLGFR